MSTTVSAPRWYHVGPHGYYDLVRLARRGRTALVRVAYVLAMFAALAAVYYSDANERFFPSQKRIGPQFRVEERQDIANRNARIAERFCITILVMQNLAVFLLMPIYIAASIQEDRDTHTLPLLFTTQLTGQMIVLGKWLSRVGQVGSVLLAGLPILAFAQLWGGIDMPMIAANFCNTGMMLLSVGALSMSVAVQYRGFFKALAMTYVLLAATFSFCFCGLNCVGALSGSRSVQTAFLLTPYGSETHGYEQMLGMTGVLAFLHVLLAAFLLRQASRGLERQRREEPAPPADDIVPGITARRNRWWRFPPIPEDVVAWKERYFDASLWTITPVAVLPVVLYFLMVMSMTSAGITKQARSDFMEVFYPVWVFGMLVTAGAYILLVSFRLAGCLVRERQQRTLEALLVLPFSKHKFLVSKVEGNLLRYWTWLLPFGIAWLFLMIFASAKFYGVVLLLAVPIHLAFFAMLGLFLSVICRTALSAYMSLGVILFVLLIGTLFVPLVMPGELGLHFACGLNPAGFWTMLCLDPHHGAINDTARLRFLSLVFYFVGAAVLWGLTCRQFARNPCGS